MAAFSTRWSMFRTGRRRSRSRVPARRGCSTRAFPLISTFAAFPVGMATRTLLLKAEIGLWRREAERFRLEVARSFSPYVAAVLDASARDQDGS